MLYIVYIVYTVVNLLNLTSFGASFNCTQKTAFEYMNNIRYKTIICLWESERENNLIILNLYSLPFPFKILVISYSEDDEI